MFAVLIVMRPPVGIDARAFAARWRINCSICSRSANTGPSPFPSSMLIGDVRPGELLELRGRSFDRTIEVDDLRARLLRSADGEQLLRERGAARSCGADRVEVALRRRILQQVRRRTVDLAEHLGEVERDASREAAHRLLTVRLAQLAVETLELRHVARRDRRADELSRARRESARR